MKNVTSGLKLSSISLFLLLLAGCATTHPSTGMYHTSQDGAPQINVDVSKIPDAVPKVEPLSKYGNPPCYVVDGEKYTVLKTAEGYDQTGIASWYGTKFYKQYTSNREIYNPLDMTAASKVLPLPTYVQVTNLENGNKIIVRVNDRGPFKENRIIDLSYVAAKKLGVTPKGTALVEVKAIDPCNPQATLAAPTTVPVGNPQIYIQIGAFSVQQNADNLQNQIKQLTQYPVIIQTATKNGAPLYRVQIGPVPDVDSTDSLHDELKQDGLGEPITVIQ